MTAGRLAAAAPAATTNTVLYSTNSLNTASTVLQVAERGGSAATYRVGHKNYTQELTLDANTYKFAPRNVVSNYKMEILPGISRTDATPGLAINSADLAKSAFLADVFVDTSIITNYVKVMKTTSFGIDTNAVVGTFQGGETVTGGTSGFTATARGVGTQFNAEVADITSGATSINISDGTLAAANAYFVLSDGVTGYTAEIVQISSAAFYTGATGGADMTVVRAQLGTTAAAHQSGQVVTIYQAAAGTTTINEGAQFAAGDTTLTVTDGTTGITGQYVQVGNEVMLITAAAGNDWTVTRGQFGTTDAAHADGATVTPWTAGAQGQVNWFDGSETVTGGTSNATATTQFTPTSSATYTTGFVWGTTAGQEVVPNAFTMDVDRTYRFDQSDSSNTGLPLRFSDTQDGTGAQPTPGTEFTTGVTKTGTAGTDGVIDIVPDAQTPDPIFYYAEGTTGYSASIDIVPDPVFTEVFLYDVEGTWVQGDTFTIGTATLTVGTVTGGKYGYVSEWDSANSKLYVTLGVNSAAFAGTDTFVDTPPETGADRTTATVSSAGAATDLLTRDYIYYDYAIAANATNKHSGIVVGPNSHIIVYASTADLTFQVNGFENAATDFLPAQYNQTTGTAGGGAGGAQQPGNP